MINKKPSDIDLSQMYIRYAEIRNISQVAREFGLSRYQVRSRWAALSDDEQLLYTNKIDNARNEALNEHTEKVVAETKNYIERLDIIRSDLLKKLEGCIENLKTDEKSTISALKDASITLKNLQGLLDEGTQKDGTDIFEQFTKMSKIYERKS